MDIADSDAFLDMPLSTQSLYFHLGMRADDEGFVSNPKRIMRLIGANEDDLKILIAKKFVLKFDSGICLIKHWRMNNYLQKDRCKPTVYTGEKKLVSIKENGSYKLMDTRCIQDVYSLDSQYSIGEVSIGEISNSYGHPSQAIKILIDQIYKAYPRKVSKQKAILSIKKAIKIIDPNELLEIVKIYNQKTSWMEKTFIPHPATWFNAHRWLDDQLEWEKPISNKTQQQHQFSNEMVKNGGF